MEQGQEEILQALGRAQDPSNGLSLEEKRAAREEKDSDSTRKLRHGLQYFLLVLLTIEVVFLMYIILSQGVSLLLFTKDHFTLNQWAFGIFANAALAQTYFLIRPIAADLFPGKKSKQTNNNSG